MFTRRGPAAFNSWWACGSASDRRLLAELPWAARPRLASPSAGPSVAERLGALGVKAPSVSQNVVSPVFYCLFAPTRLGGWGTHTFMELLSFNHGWAGPCRMALGVPHWLHPQCAWQQPSDVTTGRGLDAAASRFLQPLARGLCREPHPRWPVSSCFSFRPPHTTWVSAH